MEHKKDGYQGWTNYETWSVNLYMENDAGDAARWLDDARTALADAEPEYAWVPSGKPTHLLFTRKEVATFALSETMKGVFGEEADRCFELLGGCESVMAQLLTGAVGVVEWREVARHWLDKIEA